MAINNTNSEHELVEKLVCVNRVTKVVKGGRDFSFAVILVVGDKKGLVGFGVGKAKEVVSARAKATKAARKNLVRVPLREGRTIHHDVQSKFGAGKVVIRNAPAGTGIIAGGAMRAVFEAVGIQDIVAKSLSTSNPYSLIKATFAALLNTSSPKRIAAKRGKKVGEIISRRNRAFHNKKDQEAMKEASSEKQEDKKSN